MIILKILFLWLGIWFTIVNFMLFFKNQRIPTLNFIIMSIGLIGFIALQFNLI